MFQDEDNLRGKTLKAGQIARAASIFGVQRIYIYRDASKNYDRDYELAKEIFEYLETPQYLRKRLISRKADLEFVGLLSPLRIPHHMSEPQAKEGEIREACLLLQNGELMADIGVKENANYEGRGQANQRVTVEVVSIKPLRVKQVRPPEDIYWGYEIRRAPNLARFIRSANFGLTIFTSRLGEPLSLRWQELLTRSKNPEGILLCFGSPEEGVDFMLKQENVTVRDFPKAMYLNFFPFQKVATVRLEEALLGCLTTINSVVCM